MTTRATTTAIGRIPIRNLQPAQPEGPWPSKAYVGEVVPFSATIFREGHDLIGAQLELTDPDGVKRTIELSETARGSDMWRTEVRLDIQGTWTYRIRSYADDWATWLHAAEIKTAAGVDSELMCQIGIELLDRALGGRGSKKSGVLTDTRALLADSTIPATERVHAAHADAVAEALGAQRPISLVTLSAKQQVRVERRLAGYGAWYEFFPRSEGATVGADGAIISGNFRTAVARLADIAASGFDVLYLPPIHPIGEVNRKGPNNTLVTEPGDPGSPWAIGSRHGGHEAIHPDLGTLDDFAAFVAAARDLNIEIALDLALQCAPDHPWVAAHPEWFTTLPDGTIAYAENPPKKYQDIYPLNFDNDPQGLRDAVLQIVELWISRGITVFRVDNPHTKPVEFWEWLIGSVNASHPDVIFLAEAFTRPPMMHALAAVGFQQSYTYFTWRNKKWELGEYLTELSHETSAFFRPNFFVNTPDILTEYLQFGGVPAYKIRAALAATGSPTWGMYTGYELIENVARPGSEENIDNEKYEYKIRDFDAALADGTSIAPYISRLNQIRRENPALQQLRNVNVQWSDDDAILVFSKHIAAEHTDDGRPNGIIVVANTDPHSTRETTIHLDMSFFGLTNETEFAVVDLISGDEWTWSNDNFVRVDAFTHPVHILQVQYPEGHTA
ncbi:MAG: alpha-1,4-glucan--maltose-1-phosphate maltosyltransferase [Microbacteriaceae bacterium]